MKRVLMVSFQFPPFVGSVGVQRTLRFVQHLREFDWEPIVLTAQQSAYETVDEATIEEIPPGTRVFRTLALDAKRHLGIAGRYPGFMASPDRWKSWIPASVAKGIALSWKYKPAVIWATYPIPSALEIGRHIHRLTGVPLVSDFRDLMAQDNYPPEPTKRAKFMKIERESIATSGLSVFATKAAVEYYIRRYPMWADRFRVVENGYDEGSFAAAEPKARAAGPLIPGRITLLHSGVIYEQDRDPRELFKALASLKARGLISRSNFALRLRATHNDEYVRKASYATGIEDLIELAPAILYRDALAEMVRADGLVLLAGKSFDCQVPAKLYEYLRAGGPVLGLAGCTSSAAEVLRTAGLPYQAPLESAERIESLLVRFIHDLRSGAAVRPDTAVVSTFSRKARTRELATLFEELSQAPTDVPERRGRAGRNIAEAKGAQGPL